MKRLLLVEFFATALRRNEKSMLFPFLKGLASDLGVETRWLCFGGDYAQAPKECAGRTILARLPAADLRALSQHLEGFAPTHAITSDILCPEAKALLTGRKTPPKALVMSVLPDAVFGVSPKSELAPHVALVSADPKRRDYFARCAWFLDWLGLEAPALAQTYLVSGARPDYAAVQANAAARLSPAHITLVSGGLCGNRRTLRGNSFFKDVDLSGVRRHYGCSFCSSASMPSLTPPGSALGPVVEKQFRGILDTAGKAGRDKGIYEFFDFRAFLKFDEVFEIVLRLKVPPSVFLFNPRLDDVLRVRSRIEATLPALARAGHAVRFLSMGIENFSERENARFNKDISLAQVDEFLDLVKGWEAVYPGVLRPFKAGHEKIELGFILFTPWTTLADLRLNLTRARERRFSERGYWLYSTLHIRDVEPIYQLARREGDVLLKDWPDRGQAYGLVKNEGEAGPLVPWRFKEPRIADYFALLVRVCAADREGARCSFFRGDPAFALAARLYARARARAEVEPLAFALELLSVLEAAPPQEPPEALLRRALDKPAARGLGGEAVTSKKPAARLLLIEFFPDALRRNEGSMLFPFLQGLAREQGLRTAWLCFGARRCLMAPGAQEWTASVGAGETLGAFLESFRPTHVISSEKPAGAIRERIDASSPRPAFVVMPSLTQARAEQGAQDEVVSCEPGDPRHYAKCAWFLEWLGLDRPEKGPRYLIEEASPDYATRFADEEAATLKPLLSIAGGVLCGNRRDLRKNPVFQGLLAPSAEGRHGCSFCGSDRASLTSRGADILSLVEKQFRGLLATAGPGGRDKGLYEFYDIRAFWRFDEVFAVILRLKVPPGVFLFNPRVDDVLRVKDRIARTLPALERAGHEVRILSMGIENFSAAENARFNKGITVAQVDAFLELARSWSRAYPAVFKPFKGGGEKIELGFILFTPWTTLEDLKINLEHATARAFAEKGYWLYSTLSIRPDDPLFLLAQKEGGILGEGFSDKGQLFGLFKNEGDAAKVARWRFKDPRTADFFAVLVRVCAVDRGENSALFFAEDPLFALAQSLYPDEAARLAAPPLAVALALLDLMGSRRPPRSRESLLRDSVRRALAAAPPRPRAEQGPVPREPLSAGTAEGKAIDEVGRLLRGGKSRALAGISIESAWAASPAAPSIRLDLFVDGRALSIALFAPAHPGPFFFRSTAFKVSYLTDGPAWGAGELGRVSERLRMLTALIERRLEALRAAQAP